ncbi:sucrose phosphorylase, partial [Ilumatobacter sp.]|uniref:sucrose phosphorylase n=1 Tax=Ilumatobacter sp. TaxID=1967498 RepID=UPI003C4B0000
MRDQPQLVTYADRLAGDLAGLRSFLNDTVPGAFGGVHVLPFFVPIDGSDAGFDPADHTTVDPRLGTWSDVADLGRDVDVTADLIVNHISTDSAQFIDWMRRGDESPHASMFLSPAAVFGGEPTDIERATIFRPRPTPPFHDVELADGSTRTVWSTFTHQQIDIDVESGAGWDYLIDVLDRFGEAGVDVVRLDAIGYAIKRAGTSCFMIPETYAFIDRLTAAARERDMSVLVEVHGYHRDQIDVAARVDRVYDFALPPLAIDAVTTGDAEPLRAWIRMRPNNAINVLDTHDGIGVIDVGVDQRDRSREGVLFPARIRDLIEGIHARSKEESLLATGAAAANLDLYQVNCTFYDALGRDDARYLAARMIQLMLPGIPQIYYVGLLAGSNDMDLLAKSGDGRDINRHHYTDTEIAAALGRPVVRELLAMLRWRATDPAFDGEFELVDSPAGTLRMRWTNGAAVAD